MQTQDTTAVTAVEAQDAQVDVIEAADNPLSLSLQDFVTEFGDELLDSLSRSCRSHHGCRPGIR